MFGRRCICPSLFLLSFALISCGGGGGAPSGSETSGGNTGTGGAPLEGTARFLVNVETGDVSVTPLTASSRAIFAGGAIGFDTSTFLNQGGDTGRRGMRVRLKNRTSEAIGSESPEYEGKIRVTFTGFNPVTAVVDLRTLTTVSTAAGSGVAGYQDGPDFSATFRKPNGVAVAADGSVVIADTDNNRLRKLGTDGQVQTFAGSGTIATVDGAGSAASFNKPFGIASAPDGGFYVAESGGSVIRYVSSSGVVRTIAGTGALGSNDGSGNVATFNKPEGVAVGQDGRIYVSDSLANKIRVVIPPAGSPNQPPSAYTVQTLAGSGVSGSLDGIGSSAQFKTPRGIGVAPDGAVYVADRNNHRIRRISPSGDVVTIAGNTATHVDGNGATARFDQPSGLLVLGNGALVVSEAGNQDLRQLVLSSGSAPNVAANWNVSTVAGTIGLTGFANGSGTSASFNLPTHLALSERGILVADPSNHAVRLVASGFGFPLPDQGGTVAADPPRLSNAVGLNARDQQYMEFPGVIGAQESSDEQLWTFDVPEGVKAFEFIVTVEAATEVSTLLAGVTNVDVNGVGSPQNYVRLISGNTSSSLAVNGTLSTARYSTLDGICRAEDGTIFLSDSRAVRRISPAGEVSLIAGRTSGAGSQDGSGVDARFSGPGGMAVEPDGKTVYLIDGLGQTVRLLQLTGKDPSNAADWTVATIAGVYNTAGDTSGNGDVSLFRSPTAVARLGKGSLLVVEAQGNRIRAVVHMGGDVKVAANWEVSVAAGSSTAVPGTTDATGTSARFSTPADIAVDAAGNAYIAEIGSDRVRKMNRDRVVTTLAGGTDGHVDGVGTAARFKNPGSIAVTPSGYLYVGEQQGGWIRRVSPSGVVTTVCGASSVGGIDGPGNLARTVVAQAMVVLPSGELLFVGQARILSVQRIVGP